MNRYIPHEPLVFRPHSAIKLGDKSFQPKPMARYTLKGRLYRLWMRFSQVVYLLLILSAVASVYAIVDLKKSTAEVSYLK